MIKTFTAGLVWENTKSIVKEGGWSVTVYFLIEVLWYIFSGSVPWIGEQEAYDPHCSPVRLFLSFVTPVFSLKKRNFNWSHIQPLGDRVLATWFRKHSFVLNFNSRDEQTQDIQVVHMKYKFIYCVHYRSWMQICC